ncbi:MAG: hypothetical protein LBG91_02290 [Treponema sp.]|jgi:hypothetical protein|nr:hypothetical protein [Treponema sp.]
MVKKDCHQAPVAVFGTIAKALGMTAKGLGMTAKVLGTSAKGLGTIAKGFGTIAKGFGMIANNVGMTAVYIAAFGTKTISNKEAFMPNKRDYIPQNSGKFDKFFKNVTQYVGLRLTEWSHIPAEARTSLNDEYAGWYTAYALTFKPHSKVETLGKNNAYKKASKHLRKFINQYLRYPPVIDEDRRAMDITVHSQVKTPVNVPSEYVEFFFRVTGPRQVKIFFRVMGSLSKARPYGYRGAAVCWLVSGKPAVSVDELVKNDTASRTPYVMNFTDAERGKTVSAAMRWENEKGGKGPWSEIQSTIVP